MLGANRWLIEDVHVVVLDLETMNVSVNGHNVIHTNVFTDNGTLITFYFRQFKCEIETIHNNDPNRKVINRQFRYHEINPEEEGDLAHI